MTNKQAELTLRKSEARILVFLDNSTKDLHYVQMISIKLKMDYGHLGRRLAEMVDKDWLSRNISRTNRNRTYYELVTKGYDLLQTAKKILGDK